MRHWWSSAGVWLGIGASPAALVLGASLADRHGGALPVPALAASSVVVVALLVGQGRIGLAPPNGDGGTLGEVMHSYLGPIQRLGVSWLLVAAMTGWLGFNAGLGGAAVGSLTGSGQVLGVALFGLPLLPLALSDISRWNAVAVVAAASALVVGAQVLAESAGQAAARWPLGAGVGDPLLAIADVSAVVGYIAVFAVRGPDFTAGMGSMRDLVICVALLVVPLVVATVLGALMWSATGTTDLVGELERSPAGTVLVAVSMVAPALTAYYSGGLAWSSATPWGSRAGTLAVGAGGLLLAATGFHEHLLRLLFVLGAALPSLVVPMGTEARARRRGLPPRAVPAWTWVPASAVAVLLVGAGLPWGPVAGLSVAAVATAGWRLTIGANRRRVGG